MEFYTIPEVAKILHVAPEAVRRQIRRGKLRGRKPGKHWLVKKEDLSIFINKDEKNDEQK